MTKATKDGIALDRATVRRFDQDGHLFVEKTPISKAIINPYLGREIPGFEALGLTADREYRLLRDPDELSKGASSFAGKPLLLIHTPISADDHPREVVVGSIGDEVEFESPYLVAPLNVWDGEAIKLIQSGEQKELSCGYRYRPDMTPGNYEGEPYDGVMRDIQGNHLALVEEGRAGPDVVVGDSKKEITMSKTKVLSRKAAATQGALTIYLKPKLAQDAKVDLTAILAGLTAKNFKAKRPDILAGLKKATAGKLATDATLEDVADMLDALEEVSPAEDEMAASSGGPAAGKPRGYDSVKDFLKDKLSAEDMKACDEMMDDQEAMDEGEETEEEVKARKAKEAKAAKDKAARDKAAADEDKDDKVDKKAMDAAIDAAKREVRAEMQRTQREIREAEETVRPYIGKLAMAHDSAEAIYRTALGSLGVKDVEKLHPDALKPILLAHPVPGVGTKPVSVAMDAAGVSSFHEMFPEAKSHVVKTL